MDFTGWTDKEVAGLIIERRKCIAEMGHQWPGRVDGWKADIEAAKAECHRRATA